MVENSFRCIPQLGLIYLYNPKVACRTIQHNLSAAAGAQFVENIFEHPLFGSPALREMTSFSVVRNPFLRILSGYLNKIVDRIPEWRWRRFALEHGIDPDENQISFIDFLRIIDTECDETINAHFLPQYLNLMMPFSRPRFVGRLENFAEVENFLLGRGVEKIVRKGKATNASSRLSEFYTAEAEAIVARKFADDFRLFGYSPRLSDVSMLLEPQWQTEGPDLLMEWLAGKSFPADQLDPAPRAFAQFLSANDREKRMEIIRENYFRDDNTKRLAAYARRARQDGEEALARAIEERLQTLKNAWRDCVDDHMKLVPAKKRAVVRPERRALRLKDRGAKHNVSAEVES